MKLLTTKGYLLLIDEEAEIKVGDYFLNPNFTLRECDNLNVTKYGNIQDKHKHSWKLSMCKGKVIGYYSLKKESKDLDLPFLPSIHNKENDIEEILNKYPYNDFTFREKSGFKVGYRLAQSKTSFTLEDIKDALNQLADKAEYGISNFSREDIITKIIQSLSTQQLPKVFIPEYEYRDLDYVVSGWSNEIPKASIKGFEKRLKTIINSEGKKVLVGIYQY